MADGPRTLFIACGALAREFLAVSKANGWDERMEITCLPAIWHNTPNKIAEGVRRKIKAGKKKFDQIYVLYGDCGTGGELDQVLAEEGVERMEGPHCYQWFAGTADFEKLMDDEPGTFFLTDYLARHFDRLIWQGFGIEKHPELQEMYVRQLSQAGLPGADRRCGVAGEGEGRGGAFGSGIHPSPHGLRRVRGLHREEDGVGVKMAQLVVVYWRDIPPR